MYYRILFFIITFLSLPVSSHAKTLLVLGDSLSAAYGMSMDKGWVSLLEQRLVGQEYDYKVVNASISGETTLGAKARLHQLLRDHNPNIVIVELGGNDGLRGFQLSEIETNLAAIVEQSKNSGSEVLLVPMQLPPNYGAAYNQRFMGIYERIAEKMNVSLSEFILEDVALNPDLMQADGIHPVEQAQSIMLDNVWPGLEGLLIQ